MDFLLETIRESFRLVFSADAEVMSALAVSLQVSSAAAAICGISGIPAAYVLWRSRFPGRGAVLLFNNAMLGVPTVALGMVLYLVLCRRGPMGFLELLYTKEAMILGEALLGLPIVISLGHSTLSALNPAALETALTLGAGRFRTALTLIVEARIGLAAAVMTAFGRLLGEVGVSMILGGNIAGDTRNIPTAIALETGKGESALCLSLGMILIAAGFVIFVLLRAVQGSARGGNA